MCLIRLARAWQAGNPLSSCLHNSLLRFRGRIRLLSDPPPLLAWWWLVVALARTQPQTKNAATIALVDREREKSREGERNKKTRRRRRRNR